MWNSRTDQEEVFWFIKKWLLCERCFIHCFTIDNRQWNFFTAKFCSIVTNGILEKCAKQTFQYWWNCASLVQPLMTSSVKAKLTFKCAILHQWTIQSWLLIIDDSNYNLIQCVTETVLDYMHDLKKIICHYSYLDASTSTKQVKCRYLHAQLWHVYIQEYMEIYLANKWENIPYSC